MTMAVLRIIPHRNVRNNETRRLFSALHDLFYDEPTKNPIGLVKRMCRLATAPLPHLWWIIHMTADPTGKKSVEFFTAMPESYVDAYKTKFRGHEGWKSCSLDPIERFDGTPDDAVHTDLYKLKYKRHDMFSLEYNYAEQETPIREVMGVVEELKAGESVILFIRLEALGRMKWKEKMDYAWQTWKKGEMVYRAGLDPMRLARNAYALGQQGFHELHSFGTDMAGSVKRQFFKNDGLEFQKKDRPKRSVPDREELLVNGDLSQRTKQKRNLPAFKTAIRFAVTSADPVRRGMLARSLANAFEETDKQARWKDNVLTASKVHIHAKQQLANLTNWKISDLEPNVMSIDEVGKLCQLPTAQLQEDFKEMLQSNQRVEIELPKVFLDGSGILVGTATDRGATHGIHIPTGNRDRLFTPRAVNGSPRMGKDQHIINLIVEAKRKHGIGAIIPDFIDERGRDAKGHQRGMANAIRDHLGPEDVIDLDMSNTAYSFYLGLQSIFKNVSDPRIAADIISEYLTDFLLADGDEDKFQTAEFAREAAKATMGDLLGMKHMFYSQKYRRRKIEEMADVLDMDIWRDFDSLSEKGGGMSGRQGQLAAPVLRRIGQLLDREFLKTMFCQERPNPAADLYKWIQEGKVVIFRVKMPAPLVMPEPVKQILAYWIVLIAFLINLSLGGLGPGCLLVLNEPHQFLSAGLVRFLERLLSEGPKFRFTPVIAFHDFSQFKRFPGFVDMLLASSVNWHLFKNTNADVYKRLMPYLSKTFQSPQEAFEATKAFQYIAVWLNECAEYEPPFVCDALPLVGDRYETMNNEWMTAEHIKRYGRPTKEVLEEIKRRNKVS